MDVIYLGKKLVDWFF